ncbi:MAG: alpha/beta fold hydrolase [Flavobacteriales bacterium]|nr:MAG: alpha/beta fold hydrolase [Flavobacteriales bacterium]
MKFCIMKTTKKTELSLDIDGSKILFEYYGDINNAKKIVLFCHGFPGSSRLIMLGNNLKDSAISLVEIHYRGDKKSEGKFSFLGSIKDIRTVAGYLKEKYKVPLHALGYSMGGFYVTNIINKEPGIFDHIILLNPVVDTISLFSNKQLMDQLWEHAKNILSLKPTEDYEEEISEVIGKLNPLGFVEKLTNKITIIQSTKDEVLASELVKKFYTLLSCEKSYREVVNATHDLMGDEKELIDAILNTSL